MDADLSENDTGDHQRTDTRPQGQHTSVRPPTREASPTRTPAFQHSYKAGPLLKAVTLVLTGGDLTYRQFMEQLRLPREAWLRWADQLAPEPASAFRVRSHFPAEVLEAASRIGYSALPPKPAFVEYTVRGVPLAASEGDLLEDLRARLGLEFVAGVRRLHRPTEGPPAPGGSVPVMAPDSSRPIPVIIVSVAEEKIGQLRDWKVFGGLQPHVSSKPRATASMPQCPRCFVWGHRRGACKVRPRCAACGERSHFWDDCPVKPAKEEDRRCFACGGHHSVRYRGCPRRLEEEARVRAALHPPPPTSAALGPPSHPVRANFSYSDAAAATHTTPRFAGLPVERARTSSPSPPRQEARSRGRSQHRSSSKPQTQARSASRAPMTVRRSGELGQLLDAARQQRERQQADLDRVEAAAKDGPNPALLARARELRGRLRKTKARLSHLNQERRQLDTYPTEEEQPHLPPPQPAASLGEGVRRFFNFLRPVLAAFGIDGPLVHLAEDLVLQLVEAIQCL